MITITKHLRSVVAPPASETQVFQYHIERAKIQVEESRVPEVFQETHPDPLISHFQPFGKGTLPITVIPQIFEKKRFVENESFWNTLYWYLGVSVLAIAVVLAFQLFLTNFTYHGSISPLPR